jgi:hypothetical protein
MGAQRVLDEADLPAALKKAGTKIDVLDTWFAESRIKAIQRGERSAPDCSESAPECGRFATAMLMNPVVP